MPATTVAPETVERLRELAEAEGVSLGRAMDMVVDLYRERGGDS